MSLIIAAAAAALYGWDEPQFSHDDLTWLRTLADCAPLERCVELLEDPPDLAARPGSDAIIASVALASLYRYGEEGLEAAVEGASTNGGSVRWQLHIQVVTDWPGLTIERSQELGLNLVPRSVLTAPVPTLRRPETRFGAYRQIRAYEHIGVPAENQILDILSDPDLPSDFRSMLVVHPEDHAAFYVLLDRWTAALAQDDLTPEERSRIWSAVVEYQFLAYPYMHRLEAATWATAEQEEAIHDGSRWLGMPGDAQSLAARCAELAESVPEWNPHSYKQFSVPEALWGVRTCLSDFAAIGRLGAAAAAPIRALVHHEDRDIRMMALQALSHVGDDPGALEAALNLEADDWWLVLSAVRALKLIGDPRHVGQITQIAAEHWHPLVRKEASEVRDTLQLFQSWGGREVYGSNPRSVDLLIRQHSDHGLYGGAGTLPPLRINPSLVSTFEPRPEIHCASERFEWRGLATSPADRTAYEALEPEEWGHPQSRLPHADGAFLFSDYGEWSGTLIWRDADGAETELMDDNIKDVIALDDDTVLVTTGLAHLSLSDGTAFRLDREEDGRWRINRIGSALSPPYWSARLDDDYIAMRTNEGLYILNEDGMIGMGHCVPAPPWEFESR